MCKQALYSHEKNCQENCKAAIATCLAKIMEKVNDKEIIKAAKSQIKSGGDCALLWLMSDSEEFRIFKLPKDVNRAQQIANKMIRGMRYEIFDGHNPKDIFVRQRSDYIPKVIALIAVIIGALGVILKYL